MPNLKTRTTLLFLNPPFRNCCGENKYCKFRAGRDSLLWNGHCVRSFYFETAESESLYFPELLLLQHGVSLSVSYLAKASELEYETFSCLARVTVQLVCPQTFSHTRILSVRVASSLPFNMKRIPLSKRQVKTVLKS